MNSRPNFGLTLALALALLLGMAGCAGRRASAASTPADSAGTKTASGQPPHVLRGKINFEAEYDLQGKGHPAQSSIPVGTAPVKRLRVCLYEQVGRQDFDVDGHAGDDIQLGCRDTGRDGSFEFRVSKSTCPRIGRACEKRLYLVTALCAWRKGVAQACVTANTKQGKTDRGTSWSRPTEYRKFIWSRTYRLALNLRTSNLISWNLSCPQDSGEGRPHLACDRPSRGGRFDHRNSNYGFNAESLHAYVSTAEAIDKFGSFIPTSKMTLAKPGRHCGGPKDTTKKSWQCQDAMRIVIRKMRRMGMAHDRHCGKGKWDNFFLPLRSLCIGNPMRPYSAPHEIGHLVHARWMNYRGGMNGGPVGWRKGEYQKSQVGEGWANFFATATWFEPDANNPVVNGHAQETASSLRGLCKASGPQGELPASQFFWDLYDAPKPSEPEDQVQLDLWTMLKVWSLFAGKSDGIERKNRTRGECDPHGRNIKDYLYYYRRFPGRKLPDPGALLELNCMSGHIDGVACSAD